MLKIHGLKKKFKNFQALNGLDMEIEEGALYGFVGPNGAGKTTAIRIITGLLLPDEGTVEIAGKDAVRCREEVKDYFGYVPDEFGMYDNLKVWEYMEFFVSLLLFRIKKHPPLLTGVIFVFYSAVVTSAIFSSW